MEKVHRKVEVRKEAYANGKIFVRADYKHADDVIRYVESGQFLNQLKVVSQGENQANRRMNQLFTLHLPFTETDMRLKIVTDNPTYRLGRRINLMVNRWFYDYGKRGFEGTLSLEAIGVPTYRAIGYWTYWRTMWMVDSYFLYEDEPADMTVFEFRRAVESGELPDALKKVVPRMHREMARITRKLHDNGLRHGDIVEHNFLVTFLSPLQEAVVNFELHLIDNDHVRRGMPQIPLLKQIHDMRCLRRLRLSPDKSARDFLQEYLGKAYNSFWLAVYRYYNSEWHRPVRHLRHRFRSSD